MAAAVVVALVAVVVAVVVETAVALGTGVLVVVASVVDDLEAVVPEIGLLEAVVETFVGLHLD